MSEEAPNKVGRPSKYTPQLGIDICARLAEGESLRAICKTDGMPSAGTVCRWLIEPDKKEFQEQYARAREIQAELMADEMLDIADDGTNDWMERQNDKGENIGWQVNGEAMQRSRLRLDARKWVAAKLLPKKYGERQQFEHTAPQLDGPPSDAMEIARRMLFMLQLGAKQAAEQPTQH